MRSVSKGQNRLFVASLLTAAILLLASCSQKPEGVAAQGTAAAPVTVAQSRTVRLPVHVLAEGETAESAPPERLLIAPGAEDELPEGPNAFEVLPGERFVVTDPLRRRLAVYDTNGKFVTQWPIGFVADLINLTASGRAAVRDAGTGEVRTFDQQGQPQPEAEPVRELEDDARLLGPQEAVISRPRTRGQAGGTLQIKFEMPGFRLVSVMSIDAEESTGATFAALEISAGGDQVDVRKQIRKYAADGKLLAQVTDIPLDYYVQPVREFQVRQDVLYQLMPLQNEVRVNVWNMK
jgi:hypothetical protein